MSVYARPTDAGDPSDGTGDNFTIDGYNNLQYPLQVECYHSEQLLNLVTHQT